MKKDEERGKEGEEGTGAGVGEVFAVVDDEAEGFGEEAVGVGQRRS